MPCMLLLRLTLLYVGSRTANGFLANSNLSLMGTRNISCALMSDINALIPYVGNHAGSSQSANISFYGQNDVCFFQHMTVTTNNGSVVDIYMASWMNNFNPYKQFIRERCLPGQFQPSVTPIGYGTCRRSSFETATTTMCICSTNNCNVNYSTCAASVQATLSTPPANLPFVVPELTNLISCHQGYQGSTFALMYNGADSTVTGYTALNMSALRAYASSHAVACVIYADSTGGEWYQDAMIYENYANTLAYMLAMKAIGAVQSYDEGPSNIVIKMGYVNLDKICFCTTNNCNQNLSTCSMGLNANVSMSTATTQGTNLTNGTTELATTAAPATTSGSKQCFSGTSRVRREDGFIMMMRDVSIGDRLLVAPDQYSPVLTFFVQQQQGPSINYLRVSTSESTLEITPSHLILMRRRLDGSNLPRYLRASRLRPGDHIFSIERQSNETMKPVEVIQVEHHVRRADAFAPVTAEGTLIVDDIQVSCYANYEYHSLIHLVLLPYRLWYAVSSHILNLKWDGGLHSYISFWMKAVRYLHPLIQTL